MFLFHPQIRGISRDGFLYASLPVNNPGLDEEKATHQVIKEMEEREKAILELMREKEGGEKATNHGNHLEES